MARENAFPEIESQAFVGRQEMHRERLAIRGQWGKWLRATAAQTVLLYGESPWRVISVSLGTILACGALYPFGLFERSEGGTPTTISNIGEWAAVLPDSLYFSTLTFTTLGFGDYRPVGIGKLLATLETGLGVTLLALLVFVLGRRAAR